jgi:hypothetical protein
MAQIGKRSEETGKSGGRRRNYEVKVVETGMQRYVPKGWANWLGLVMFGLIAVAMAVDAVVAASKGRGADPVAAVVVALLLGWMALSFARNREVF